MKINNNKLTNTFYKS